MEEALEGGRELGVGAYEPFGIIKSRNPILGQVCICGVGGMAGDAGRSSTWKSKQAKM